MPTLLLGPVAGVLIDRFDRQRVLVAADLVRAAPIVALVFTCTSTKGWLVLPLP